MSENWFQRYRSEVNRVRGSWKTHPPLRRVMYEQQNQALVLAYGAICLLEHLKE